MRYERRASISARLICRVRYSMPLQRHARCVFHRPKLQASIGSSLGSDRRNSENIFLQLPEHLHFAHHWAQRTTASKLSLEFYASNASRCSKLGRKGKSLLHQRTNTCADQGVTRRPTPQPPPFGHSQNRSCDVAQRVHTTTHDRHRCQPACGRDPRLSAPAEPP